MVIWLDSDMAIKKEMANKKKKKSAAIKRKVATNIRSKNSSKKNWVGIALAVISIVLVSFA